LPKRCSPLPLETVISEVVAESQAERLGVRAGDVVVEVAGQRVAGLKQFQALLAGRPTTGPAVEMKLRRAQELVIVILAPGRIGIYYQDQPVQSVEAYLLGINPRQPQRLELAWPVLWGRAVW
jgi:C-terminal processing protease CtpA/Prc